MPAADAAGPAASARELRPLRDVDIGFAELVRRGEALFGRPDFLVRADLRPAPGGRRGRALAIIVASPT